MLDIFTKEKLGVNGKLIDILCALHMIELPS